MFFSLFLCLRSIQTNFLLKIQPIMGDKPIQSVIRPITADTMLNNNGLNNGPVFLSKQVCIPVGCAPPAGSLFVGRGSVGGICMEGRVV